MKKEADYETVDEEATSDTTEMQGRAHAERGSQERDRTESEAEEEGLVSSEEEDTGEEGLSKGEKKQVRFMKNF